VRDAPSDAGPVRTGDWLGLGEGRIRVVAGDAAAAACALLDLLVTDDREVVTIIEGDGATPAGSRRITEWLAQHRPGVAVEVHHGGQPLYPYLLGVE
jgi:dihydroxyacetone kinase-like predicted kinase